MRRGWMICIALTLSSAAMAQTIEPAKPVTLARGGSAGICHCPCRTGSCDCTAHSETCHRCYDVTVALDPVMLEAVLAADETPILEASDAAWFEAGPYPELKVRVEAAVSGSDNAEAFDIRFLPDATVPNRYVPDAAFDPGAYAAWRQRVDRGKEAVLKVGAKDDPATWRILDGGPERLNQSLRKSFRLLRGDGSSVEVFRSESTLGWEANLYLRSVVARIPDDALRGGANDARTRLLSLVDLADLQIKGGDAKGAVRSLDALIEGGKGRLDPAHVDTAGALCGFRKIRNLLVPGPGCR